MTQDLERNEGGLPVRELGKTGLKVSIIGFGGGHCVRPNIDEQTTVRLIQMAIDAGVTFMDNAWEYHQGESERRMGLALKGRRDQVTLMTKVCGRDRKTAEAQLHESLRRLQTDVIDVWQFHEINYDNDPDWIFQSGGALEAALDARQAGKIRFIGFTGHKSPDILKDMLAQDFDWDTCQMPINVLDAHYRSFQKEILPTLNQRNIGVIGMKSLGGAGTTGYRTWLDCRAVPHFCFVIAYQYPCLRYRVVGKFAARCRNGSRLQALVRGAAAGTVGQRLRGSHRWTP